MFTESWNFLSQKKKNVSIFKQIFQMILFENFIGHTKYM